MNATEFNTLYPVGTPVRYYPLKTDRGTFVEMVTRSPAFTRTCLAERGRPVVFVEGRPGSIPIDQLQPHSSSQV